ncbi:MAG: ABC transporter ATP-binding protein [Acidimicrobiia bacterium]|nr:ABC transporter ATP-binding protein [Acidimicrobiia bacterium]
MTATVEARGLSKWFGQKVAVSEVNVAFEPGIIGLLGPNGAGKTTLLRLFTGLQRPSQGTVQILGVDPRSDHRIFSRVAMVPEDEAVYANLTARQFVELNASLARVKDRAKAVDAALAEVDLVDVSHRKLEGYSKGMRQRAKVAAALVGNPDVLFLDEPLNGANPVQRAHLIDLFRKLGDQGHTLIVSSHVLAEVERMADRVIAMVDGPAGGGGNRGVASDSHDRQAAAGKNRHRPASRSGLASFTEREGDGSPHRRADRRSLDLRCRGSGNGPAGDCPRRQDQGPPGASGR